MLDELVLRVHKDAVKFTVVAMSIPSLSGVDQRQIAITLWFIGELPDPQPSQDFSLCDIQLVIAQICHLGVVHVKGHTIIDHAEGDGIPALADDLPVFTEGHIRLDQRKTFICQSLVIRHIIANLGDLRRRPCEVVLCLLRKGTQLLRYVSQIG